MERLPYIDTYATTIPSVSRDEAWVALVAAVRASFAGRAPRLLVRILAPEPAQSAGTWSHGSPGSALAGFEVSEARAPERLALRGRHRFSRYELVFDVEDAGADGVRVAASTSAAFPGLHGRVYRALVIGSGGHRVAVRRMLRSVRGRALAAASGGASDGERARSRE